jgi:hypothetical protein
MQPLILLLALPAVFAKRDLVSGIGKMSVDTDNIAQFNLGVYASTVADIKSSVNDGPNRTTSLSLPVQKLYGVNVSLMVLFRFLLLTLTSMAIGWYPNHGWFSIYLSH